MADRLYVTQSPTRVTTRELLPVAVSFANRLAEGETVTLASTTAGVEVQLLELPARTDRSDALSGIGAASPNVSVTIDFRDADLSRSTTYLLRVRGTIGSRKEEALWKFETAWE